MNICSGKKTFYFCDPVSRCFALDCLLLACFSWELTLGFQKYFKNQLFVGLLLWVGGGLGKFLMTCGKVNVKKTPTNKKQTPSHKLSNHLHKYPTKKNPYSVCEETASFVDIRFFLLSFDKHIQVPLKYKESLVRKSWWV